MLEAEVNNERTVLDYLNEYCWRAVLQYVPVQDLIRTERASRAWQGMVLTYLQGVRIMIEREDLTKDKVLPNYNTCSLKPQRYKSFINWTNKLGPSVVSTFCPRLENLPIIDENCPYLEALQFSRIASKPSQLVRYNLNDNFKFLREVSFEGCSIPDSLVTEFIADRALEKLEIRNCTYLRGLCFDNLNLSNLKSLALECNSESYEDQKLFSIIDQRSDGEAQSVLYKMPKLESVELHGWYVHCNASEHLSRLPRLKHLSVMYQLEDRHVDDITRCCQELRSLELLDCKYLRRLSPIFWMNAGLRLTALKLDQFTVARDDDVVSLVIACRQLQSLTIGGAERLTSALPARAAAARFEINRRVPLRLDLSHTNLSDEYYLRLLDGQHEVMKTDYGYLIVIMKNTMDEYDDEEVSDEEFLDNDFDYYDYSYDDYDEVEEEEVEEVEEEETDQEE